MAQTKNSMETGLARHPQYRRMLEAYMNGESCRSISKWANPSIAHNSIARHMKTHVKPVLARAEGYKLLLNLHNDESNTPNKAENTGVSDSGTAPDTAHVPVEHSLLPLEQTPVMMAKSAILAAPALDIRETRLKAKMERHRRLMMIVDGRAADMEHVPGGASGFLVRDYKGSGESMTEVHKFDHELVKAFEEVEKDIAIELGQWQEGAPTGSVSIQIMVPTPGSGEAPRITFAAQSPAIESVRTIEATAKTDDEGGLEVMAVQTR